MAGESWYAVFKESTGELVSTGTEVADQGTLTSKGLTVVTIPKQPDETVVWNATARSFVPAPDKPVQVVADLVVEQAELARLNDDQKERVRRAVARVVGETV